jgi:acetyl esterase
VINEEGRTTPFRIYKPGDGENIPIALLIHGGAWVAGNIDTHDNLARYLCSEANVIVISVGYLNPPEGKFPLPLEQCYDALLWAQKLGKGSRLAVVGDSAGGNMAAALCLMARDRRGPKLDLQILINPAPDLTCEGTWERQGDTLDTLRWQARQYLSDSNEMKHPYVSPLVARDLTGLPKALVLLAEKDELREMGQKYADRLRDAGNSVEIYCQMGVGHLAKDGARAARYTRDSLAIAVKALKLII